MEWPLQMSDFAVVASAVLLAELLRFGRASASLTGLSSLDYSLVSILIVAGWAGFLAVYRTRRAGGGRRQAQRNSGACGPRPCRCSAPSRSCRRRSSSTSPEAISQLRCHSGSLGCRRIATGAKVVMAMRRRGLMRSAVLAVGEPESVRALAHLWPGTPKMAMPWSVPAPPAAPVAACWTCRVVARCRFSDTTATSAPSSPPRVPTPSR